MNHHAPRQLQSGVNAGKWHYTCANDNRKTVHAVGYCAEEGRCAHETAEEACQCYARYLLDKSLRFVPDVPLADGVTVHECAECKAICTGAAIIGYGFGREIYLCAKHRDRATVEKHFSVGESFGS